MLVRAEQLVRAFGAKHFVQFAVQRDQTIGIGGFSPADVKHQASFHQTDITALEFAGLIRPAPGLQHDHIQHILFGVCLENLFKVIPFIAGE